MYIRVKADWLEDKSKKECIITLSKTTSIEELRRLIEEEVGVKPEVQRLFYRGKEVSTPVALSVIETIVKWFCFAVSRWSDSE